MKSKMFQSSTIITRAAKLTNPDLLFKESPKPYFPLIILNNYAYHPQAEKLSQRAWSQYESGNLRQCANILMLAAQEYFCTPPHTPVLGITLVETAAECMLFTGKKKKAKLFFNSAAELAELWGYPQKAEKIRKRADEIK